MRTIITILSAMFAIAAAFLWFLSAVVKTPQSFAIHVVRSQEQPLGGDPLDGTYVGYGYSNDIVSLAKALNRQSRLSAWAAICAGISAFFQSASLFS